MKKTEEKTVRRMCKPREGPNTLHKTPTTVIQRACRQRGESLCREELQFQTFTLETVRLPTYKLLIVRTDNRQLLN